VGWLFFGTKPTSHATVDHLSHSWQHALANVVFLGLPYTAGKPAKSLLAVGLSELALAQLLTES
jgi:hypothetical protein